MTTTTLTPSPALATTLVPDATPEPVYGRSPEQPEHLFVAGELVTLRLPRAESGGALSVVEVQTPPGGGVPFLHTHPGAETFVVLEGSYEIYGQQDGGKTAYPAAAGAVVHVPSQAPHGYANVGDTPGRMMLMLHGENRMEEFFRTIGLPVTDLAHPPVVDGPPDGSALAEAMCTCGLAFVEAPPF